MVYLPAVSCNVTKLHNCYKMGRYLIFVFSFFDAESKKRFSVFGLKRKKEKSTVSVFSYFGFDRKTDYTLTP